MHSDSLGFEVSISQAVAGSFMRELAMRNIPDTLPDQILEMCEQLGPSKVKEVLDSTSRRRNIKELVPYAMKILHGEVKAKRSPKKLALINSQFAYSDEASSVPF